MKKLDRKEIVQLRDSLLEDYEGLIKDSNPIENFDVQKIVLTSQINILSYILGHSFNLVTGKVSKQGDNVPDKMTTVQVHEEVGN
jgi:hypothetical protein